MRTFLKVHGARLRLFVSARSIKRHHHHCDEGFIRIRIKRSCEPKGSVYSTCQPEACILLLTCILPVNRILQGLLDPKTKSHSPLAVSCKSEEARGGQGSDGSSGPEDLTLQRERACVGKAVQRERACSHKRARGGEKEREGEEAGETSRE